MINKKVVFVGLARDCEIYLDRVLSKIERMASLFSETAFLFVENDSIDQTKKILKDWCAHRKSSRIVNLDGLSITHPARTDRLAEARNTYLEIIKTDFSDFDLLIPLDCDNMNVVELDISSFLRAISFIGEKKNCAGVFPNLSGNYSDLWALRHPTLCPGDVFEQMCDIVTKDKISDEAAVKKIPAFHGIYFDPNDDPVQVNSAFGWYGIYRIESVLRNKKKFIGSKKKVIPTHFDKIKKKHVGQEVRWQMCEHVSFNLGFIENFEELYILPYLSLGSFTGGVNPSAWRYCLIDIDIELDILHPVRIKGGSQKLSRNSICLCGSGKKFKRCHGTLV